ncbi:MAG: phosphatase, partial [Chlamydiia bacterium]|nr:phosphatase [Chlamydiia bacterium]
PHIAKRLIDAGYAKDIKEAFSLYIGDGRRCFVPSQAFSVEETLDVIRAAGGLAVIAHPMLVSRRRVLRDLLKMDFNGIEGYYACFPPEQERPYQQQGLERGWLITGGSDYHGAVKPHIRLGASWVTQETFDRLWEHAQQHKGTQH